MIGSGDFFTLLHRLREEDLQTRLDAQHALVEMEAQGRVSVPDLLEVLESGEKLFINYAITAIGRLKAKPAYDPLCAWFRQSWNPVMLLTAIDTFTSMAEPYFVQVVIEKLEAVRKDAKSSKKKKGGMLQALSFSKASAKKESTPEAEDSSAKERRQFKDYFIEFQILIPSLKFLAAVAGEGIGSDASNTTTDAAAHLASSYLSHRHEGVRWNALLVLKAAEQPPSEDVLQQLITKDPSTLVRTQAELMLAACKKRATGRELELPQSE